MCSYIEKMTPNPIHALKITICNTKLTNNTQIHFQHSKVLESKAQKVGAWKSWKIEAFSTKYTKYIKYEFWDFDI